MNQSHAALLGAVFVFFAQHTTAAEQSCTIAEPLVIATANRSVMFGEIHGTVEAPAVVKCFIKNRLAASGSVILSLEMPESARDFSSSFWEGSDGRASLAMKDLLEFALRLESQSFKVHFQRQGTDFDQNLASDLRELASKATVIALNGNFHTMHSALSAAMPQPAGSFLATGFVRISIESAGGGYAWNCAEHNQCGPRAVPKSQLPAAVKGTLTDGSEHLHDFVFFVDTFSPSPPVKGTEGVPR